MKDAQHDHELKEILLRDERYFGVTARNNTATESLIGKQLINLDLPGDAWVALLHRDGESITPHAATIVLENDRLTFIGQPGGIAKLRERFADKPEAEGPVNPEKSSDPNKPAG